MSSCDQGNRTALRQWNCWFCRVWPAALLYLEQNHRNFVMNNIMAVIRLHSIAIDIALLYLPKQTPARLSIASKFSGLVWECRAFEWTDSCFRKFEPRRSWRLVFLQLQSFPFLLPDRHSGRPDLSQYNQSFGWLYHCFLGPILTLYGYLSNTSCMYWWSDWWSAILTTKWDIISRLQS